MTTYIHLCRGRKAHILFTVNVLQWCPREIQHCHTLGLEVGVMSGYRLPLAVLCLCRPNYTCYAPEGRYHRVPHWVHGRKDRKFNVTAYYTWNNWFNKQIGLHWLKELSFVQIRMEPTAIKGPKRQFCSAHRSWATVGVLSKQVGDPNSWNPQGLSRRVQGFF